MTSTFSSVGVMSSSVSSCSSGFCGSTTAMLLSYIQQKKKVPYNTFISFSKQHDETVFLFDFVPCCCGALTCSLIDLDLVE